MGAEPGGPLHVPRALQGQGRHDIPDHDGVLYASLTSLSAIAEWIQLFRTRPLKNHHFMRVNGMARSLVLLELPDPVSTVDLDDPQELSSRVLRPSQVATYNRTTTQAVSLRLFKEGKTGFTWWSTLEASWINITLFESRALGRLTLQKPPQKLDVENVDVRAAAEALGMTIED